MVFNATKIHFSVKNMLCDCCSGASVVSAYCYCALNVLLFLGAIVY